MALPKIVIVERMKLENTKEDYSFKWDQKKVADIGSR